MSKTPIARDIDFGGPAIYRIVVQGTLNPEWSSRLGGLKITIFNREDRPAHTSLEGEIRDQAELSGVLETLHGMHLPILRVETTEDEE